MYENIGIFPLIIFTIKIPGFTIKKPILGRKPGNLEREERSDEREVAPAACGIRWTRNTHFPQNDQKH